ncbi:MAG: porin family protein [Prevotellaceae bacterium]|jgi:hypothetical protein|nr:porin family protein [Prevotellaceae bacterium]
MKRTNNNAAYGVKMKGLLTMSNLKKTLLLIAFIGFVSNTVIHAQDVETRKGFIGIGLGPAIPTGSFVKDNCDVGFQFNIDFGYLFSKNIGIAASAFGTSMASKWQSKNTIGLTGLMAGPLFSVPSGAFEFDFKPMLGYARGILYLGDDDVSSSKLTFTYGGGAAVRWNCWRKFSLSASAIYCYGKPERVDLSTIGIVVGAAYRLK